MQTDMKTKLRQLLIRHEDYELHPYTDTVGKITIGIGRNLTDRGILPTEVDMMFDHDVDYFYNFLLDHFSWVAKLNEARQIALIDLCFIGTKKFLEFTKMISAFEREDYLMASQEILDSKYATEVGQRARDLAHIIETGTL